MSSLVTGGGVRSKLKLTGYELELTETTSWVQYYKQRHKMSTKQSYLGMYVPMALNPGKSRESYIRAHVSKYTKMTQKFFIK
jgi:hypothetical protein